MSPPAQERDSGAATVLVLVLSTVVALVGCVLVALGAVATTRARAASAADLAALAAASRSLDGTAAACARAGQVAAAAGAALASCRLLGDVSEVEVRVRPAGPLAGLGHASGRARAGPAGR